MAKPRQSHYFLGVQNDSEDDKFAFDDFLDGVRSWIVGSSVRG